MESLLFSQKNSEISVESQMAQLKFSGKTVRKL